MTLTLCNRPSNTDKKGEKNTTSLPKIPLLKVIVWICKRSICKGFLRKITFLRVIIAWHCGRNRFEVGTNNQTCLILGRNE